MFYSEDTCYIFEVYIHVMHIIYVIWLPLLIVKTRKCHYIYLNWKTSLNLTLFCDDGKSHTMKFVWSFKYMKDSLNMCVIHTVIYMWDIYIYIYICNMWLNF